MKTLARLPRLSSGRAGSPGWKYGWHSSLCCCGCTNPSCKACRWSSKSPSNIHQAGEGCAACKKGWNRGGRSNHFAPSLTSFTLTAAAVSAEETQRISGDSVKKKYILFNLICDAKIELFGLRWTCWKCECVHCSCTHLPSLTCRAALGGSCHLPLPWQQPVFSSTWEVSPVPPL